MPGRAVPWSGEEELHWHYPGLYWLWLELPESRQPEHRGILIEFYGRRGGGGPIEFHRHTQFLHSDRVVEFAGQLRE